ncbi:ABC transporter permease [Streptococcus pneumoniae]|uniref:ABC transporter permease n=1 Tax=Streptococcus pneumoniae TaxID=1313 RepID=UPI000AD4A187|nr:ABC transporter permease [Streptococcus pneumoniae]
MLRFFALFTQVKGISNSVKRRAYLDFILKAVQKVPGKIWQNLYLRSYLRNSDLFALQSSSSLTFRTGAGFYRASLDCDSSGSSL